MKKGNNQGWTPPRIFEDDASDGYDFPTRPGAVAVGERPSQSFGAEPLVSVFAGTPRKNNDGVGDYTL